MPDLLGVCINAYEKGTSLDISNGKNARTVWVYLNLYPLHISLYINKTFHPCYGKDSKAGFSGVIICAWENRAALVSEPAPAK